VIAFADKGVELKCLFERQGRGVQLDGYSRDVSPTSTDRIMPQSGWMWVRRSVGQRLCLGAIRRGGQQVILLLLR
jgi:hypothetical protein